MAPANCNPDNKEASKEGVFSVECAVFFSVGVQSEMLAEGRPPAPLQEERRREQKSVSLALNLVKLGLKISVTKRIRPIAWRQLQDVSHPELVFFQCDSEFGSSGVAFGRWAERESTADKSASMSSRCVRRKKISDGKLPSSSLSLSLHHEE